MFKALQSNYGEVRSYEPILGYEKNRTTNKCGINEGCDYVNNGSIKYWSPNHIVAIGSPGGQVSINMNDTNYLVINGKRSTDREVVELNRTVVATFPASGVLDIVFKPKHGWIILVQLIAIIACIITLVSTETIAKKIKSKNLKKIK